jgi:Leucine-rich repeat (LRR) protein
MCALTGRCPRTTSTTTNTHSVLPESIGGLSSLEKLWIGGNKELKALPSTICSLSKLKKLFASGCGLSGKIYF